MLYIEAIHSGHALLVYLQGEVQPQLLMLQGLPLMLGGQQNEQSLLGEWRPLLQTAWKGWLVLFCPKYLIWWPLLLVPSFQRQTCLSMKPVTRNINFDYIFSKQKYMKILLISNESVIWSVIKAVCRPCFLVASYTLCWEKNSQISFKNFSLK